MRNCSARLLAAFALAALALGVAAAAPASGAFAAGGRASLCQANETAVFSCRIGARTASLCASHDLGPSSGYLYYAFGKPGRTELSAPAKNSAGRQDLTVGTLAYSKGGGDYVRVRNGAYAYVIYSAETPGWSQEGVAVEKGGAQISSLRCPAAASALGPDGWLPVYRAKLPSDQQGFQVP